MKLQDFNKIQMGTKIYSYILTRKAVQLSWGVFIRMSNKGIEIQSDKGRHAIQKDHLKLWFKTPATATYDGIGRYLKLRGMKEDSVKEATESLLGIVVLGMRAASEHNVQFGPYDVKVDKVE